MNRSTPRQRHLSLVARLYELAAQFSDQELRDIRSTHLRASDDAGLKAAVDALIQMHEGLDTRGEDPAALASKAESLVATPNAPLKRVRMSARRINGTVDVLRSVLQNESVFPKLQDVAIVMPQDLQPLPKEGRERYIRRVLRVVTTFDEDKKKRLLNSVNVALQHKASGSFLSDWKNLIKGL